MKLWKSQGEKTLVKCKAFFFASWSETDLEAKGHQQSVGKECVSCHTRLALLWLWLWICRRAEDLAENSEAVVRS